MIRRWTIYKITSPSQKTYIGVTSNYTKRISYYRNFKKLKQPMLSASLSKYGFSNHHFDIIEEFDNTLNYALGKEMFWIKGYMTNSLKWKEGNGLNLTDGGQGTIGWKSSPEHREKLSNAHKGKPTGRKGISLSEETKLKLSLYNKANPSRGMKGKKLTEEQRKRMSERMKGRPSPLKGFRRDGSKIEPKVPKRRVAWNKGLPLTQEQIDKMRQANIGRPSWNKGKRYNFLSETERREQFGAHNIGNQYNKGRKQSAEIVETRAALLRGKPNGALFKPIIQLDIHNKCIREFISVNEAAQITGLSAWTVGNIAKGLRRTPSEFIFKYKN